MRLMTLAIACATTCASAIPAPSLAADLWRHDNLFAWGLHADGMSRTVEKRVALFEGVDVKSYADIVHGQDEATLDAELKALKTRGIKVRAMGFADAGPPADAVDWNERTIPDAATIKTMEAGGTKDVKRMTVRALFETLKRNGINQAWLIRPVFSRPPSQSKPTPDELNEFFRSTLFSDSPKTPEGHKLRLEQETARIAGLAKLAAPFGITISLYKHGGWLGITDNQLAIFERLKGMGITNVGIAYAFVHSRDEVDDTVNFPTTWKKMQPYVTAVIVAGIHTGRTIVPMYYVGEGTGELGMMRTIQASGWNGPIGFSTERALVKEAIDRPMEAHVKNALKGVDWAAAELKKPSK